MARGGRTVPHQAIARHAGPTLHGQLPRAVPIQYAGELGLSGYYYNRIFTEYTKQRFGGRVAFGYQFTPDFSGASLTRGQDEHHQSDRSDAAVLGQVIDRNLALHDFQEPLTHDTRDSDFMPTEGHLIQVSLEEVLGSFQYPHAEVDIPKYFTLYQRPDGSGRQCSA